MNAIQILVPTSSRQTHLIAGCLESIKESTLTGHVVNLITPQPVNDEKIGGIIATARSVYDRAGMVLSCVPEGLGYNGAVMEVLKVSDFQYTVVIPVTHRFNDRDWFPKLQAPLIRVPACAMTFAFDDIEPNSNQPYVWNWREKVPGQIFMFQRNAVGAVAATPIDPDGFDLSSSVRDHLKTVAASCWAVPGCRVSSLHGEW